MRLEPTPLHHAHPIFSFSNNVNAYANIDIDDNDLYALCNHVLNKVVQSGNITSVSINIDRPAFGFTCGLKGINPKLCTGLGKIRSHDSYHRIRVLCRYQWHKHNT